MRILLVEDNIDFATAIDRAVRDVNGCDLVWRQSKSSALAVLADEPFDVVLLDRRIPSADGVLDDDPNHGWDVFQSIRERLPGTSVWFMTATIDVDFPTEMLNSYGRTGDIHASGREDAIYRVFWKSQLNKCLAAVQAFRANVQLTDAVNLSQVGNPVNLRAEEARLLRLFARKHGGTSVEARPLNGGLSGTRVLRATVKNAAGQPIVTSIGKIGSFGEIGLERDRYHGEITRLAPGSTPQVTGTITFGASGHAAIFYGVVGTEVTDLFAKLVTDPHGAAEVPGRLRVAQASWIAARAVEQVRVGAIRRRLVSDVIFPVLSAELDGIDTSMIERMEVTAAHCVQHGDLHCANVLFDDRGQPMVIDYPETGRTLASLDPVALELSTIFHRNAPPRHGWPSNAQALSWPDIDAFAAGARFEQYVRACRTWACAVAGSQQEVWAVGYAYALRQLKYQDTDKALARAIVRSCIAALARVEA